MEGSNKKVYWKGLEQLANSTEFVTREQHEFAPGPEENTGHSRRDFLKMMGFGMSAVALAACEAPIRNAIPYVNKPMDLDPSIPNYYASTYTNGGEYCSIVVKTREGRPIKIEPNTLSSVTKGGINAQVEASVLSLYDDSRLQGPRKGTGEKREKAGWADLDKEITAKLAEINSRGGQIRIVANSIVSPSTKTVLEKFTTTFPTTKVVQYDQFSAYGILKANEEMFGTAMVPSYDFSSADVIVSVGADFLNSWIAPIEFAGQYAKTRVVDATKKTMSRHYQFESILSLSGANADYRTQIKPSEEGAVLVALYNELAKLAGVATLVGGIDKPFLKKAASNLWAAKGKSLVVAGSNNKSVQVVVNAINLLLENYGKTILTHLPVNYFQGNDQAMSEFVADVTGGKIDAVIFYNCNPVYDYPKGGELATALKKVGLTIHTGYKEEETGKVCTYLTPDHHYLEAWNDANPKPNHYSLAQPTIKPIFNTRAAQESLLIWSGEPTADYFAYLQKNWSAWFTPETDFQSFWDKALYDGVYEKSVEATGASTGNLSGLESAGSAIASVKGSGLEAVVYQSGNIGNGSQANNPLLQELPDPITKAVWDFYITVSPKDAADIKFDESFTKVYEVSVNGKKITAPVLVQPGQTPGTIGIPVGYGRTSAGKVADGRGQNAYPLIATAGEYLNYNLASVTLTKTEEDYQIAQTQTHNTYMGRQSVIQETVLGDFTSGKYAKEKFNPEIPTWNEPDHKAEPESVTLWKGHEYKNHHWGMAIDLNSCIGCGACVVACNVENNVSLVGREEVIARREMHWLRIDRYYSSDADIEDRRGLEEAAENPEVVFQPMLCQHCNNAPCETVCPVAATTHSSEGLNQMTYNRCIGTRYCANNCPYKVRRFNWFKYHDNEQFANVNTAMNSDLGKMVLNPDVTVRSRGVMEKCSFCVQRIQSSKLTAKKERRTLNDGEVVTACQASCSTGAIVFGDMNNPESRISKLLEIQPLDPKRPLLNAKEAMNPRAYSVLEEIDVRPNIWYLAKVRNKDEAKA